MTTKPTSVQETSVQKEFKPFPKSKDNGNSHPRQRVGKTKCDKVKRGGE